MDRLNKISPSTSEANFNFNVTPKRNVTAQRSGSSLEAIYEDNQQKTTTPRLRNPFEVRADSLHLPACSPSVFATIQSRKANDGTFRWSIEQMSVLYPADIDETSLPEPWVDEEQEARAQQAIDTFFSQNSIVPSPWSSSPKEGKCVRSRRHRMNVLFHDIESTEATTQTTLSIPPNVDLGDILGQYFTYNDDKAESCSRDNSREDIDLSNSSSLRRKLFVGDDESNSPTKFGNKNLHSTKRWSSSSVHMRSVQSTPASDVLSSSPITPQLCSDSCNILCSPPVSPIAKASDSANESEDKSLENKELNGSYVCPTRKFSGVSSTDCNMSVYSDVQETNPFPSFRSEKLDSGYTTASIISSSHNTTSATMTGHVSRVTPVAELMEDCELSNSCDIMSGNVQSSLTTEWTRQQRAQESCSFKINPWNGTSTPAAHQL